MVKSNYKALLLLLDIFKNAKEIKQSSCALKNIIPKLPAKEIQFLDSIDEIEDHKDETIENFLKNKNFSIQTKPKRYDIKIHYDNL